MPGRLFQCTTAPFFRPFPACAVVWIALGVSSREAFDCHKGFLMPVFVDFGANIDEYWLQDWREIAQKAEVDGNRNS